jgi:Mg-chelatase subunit ChlD
MAAMTGATTASDPAPEIAAAGAALAGSRTPWLFGVRHHSPACAAALPPLLDALAPAAVAIELPEDLGGWLPWLAHPEAEAPLAVAGVSASGEELGFYPFADFSPELVAIRWARAHGVAVHAIDLPMARPAPSPGGGARRRGRGGRAVGIERRLGGGGDSWELLVEAPAVGGDPERVRRAALLYGWALRLDAARGDGVSAEDRAREAHMRARLARLGAYAASGPPVAAIVGAYHGPALLAEPMLWSPPAGAPGAAIELVSSLIPYAFELLDERSGYPAGIRDPAWQQRLWQTLLRGGDPAALVAACLVEITREIRSRGLPASVPDAQAAAAVAGSLAALRRLAAPGRRELVEAAQTALAHGELLGRGRVVARAMEQVLVGRRRGRLAPGTPRSGLAPHVLALLGELRLPYAEMVEPALARLDPLRSPLDRRRHVALCRMRACGIPYATAQASSAAGGVEALTTVWRLWFTPASEAMIELAGLRGVTLRQAAAGALRAERARLLDEERLGPLALAGLTEAAAEAGAGDLVREWLVELAGPRLAESTLVALITLIALIDRIAAGHIVGLPVDPAAAIPGELDAFEPPPIDRAHVLGAAVASILGLAGSESVADARSLAELVRVLERPEHAGLGEGRLRWSLERLAETGTPLMAGAAEVVQVLIGARAAEALSASIGGWFDAATDTDGRRALARRLHGAIAVAGPLFEAAPVFLDELGARVERVSDAELLPRVPALREGFEALSTASRRRLLRALGERLGAGDARGWGLDVATAVAPAVLLAAAEADRAGRAASARIPRPVVAAPRAEAAEAAGPAPVRAADDEPVRAAAAVASADAHEIGVRDRWRLILGHEREAMQPRARAAARALDELYGHGHGEGSRAELGPVGPDPGFPTARAWRAEIEGLFGAEVYEEVAGKAAAAGRVAALLELDPDEITPSMELLEQVLSLKGGLGERHLGRLRALVRRIVDELVRELAIRVRPALHGALGARATRRPTGALHLPRTVAANLARARVEGGAARIVPERLIWRSRTRRHLDWHVVLVVDVSGSMEASVIHSAMMAAILSSVPWIDVRFIAFSTEIVDLSEHAGDPLALLLEIDVGGGTHLARALRYARGLVAVPQRTLVLVVSDFEEGHSVESLVGEVRQLVEAGVTCLGVAALDDRGAPRYAVPIAEQVAAAGMPVAALTPVELARWIGEKIR